MIFQKGIFFLSFLFALIFSCCGKLETKKNVDIPLNLGWKIKLGDSTLWANKDYNDFLWDTITVGQNSGPKIFDRYDGYAWYRIKVFIPSYIKKSTHVYDSVNFFLGKIDDCDQAYLNGHFLGQNGITAQGQDAGSDDFTNGQNLWQIDRMYGVSVKDPRILWDTVNVIAIRVFDQYGGGGMYGKVPYIGMSNLGNYFIFDMGRFYKVDGNDSVDKRFLIKNRSTRMICSGNIFVTATKMDPKANVFNFSCPIQLKPGDSTFISVPLPISTDPQGVQIKFIDNFSGLMVVDSIEVPYVLTH